MNNTNYTNINTNNISDNNSGTNARSDLQAGSLSGNPAGGVDISKTTLIILVLLTLTISVISTWTVINNIPNQKTSISQTAATGTVQFTILPDDAPVQKQISTATGQVTFEILESE